MSATEQRTGPALRQLPANARTAAAEKTAVRAARGQFARTFADVLSGRFGGRWEVEWEGSDFSAVGRSQADKRR
jgi:hypothetical protein